MRLDVDAGSYCFRRLFGHALADHRLRGTWWPATRRSSRAIGERQDLAADPRALLLTARTQSLRVRATGLIIFDEAPQQVPFPGSYFARYKHDVLVDHICSVECARSPTNSA